MKTALQVFISLCLLVYPSQILANEVYERNQTDISKIEKYLNNIKYLGATFLQESQDSLITYGKFYLSRPGKMRIEYKEPSEILIVVNGGVLTYQDVELEETSYLRTNSTPASLLTRKNISFSAKDIEVTNFTREKGLIKLSLLKKNKQEAGEFTLTFSENPIKFIKMQAKDDMDQIVTITLEKHDFVTKIDNKLFIIKNSQLP